MFNDFYFIYSITNTKNNKRYIGYTNNVKRRLYDHFTQLNLNQHPNKKLQEDYDPKTFKAEVLEVFINLSTKEIVEIEKQYIEKYESYTNGYNQTKGGEYNTKKQIFTDDYLFEIIFILRHYEYSCPVIQKMFDISESAVLRMKNKQTYISMQQIVDQVSEEKKEEIKKKLEEKYQIQEKIDQHRKEVTLKSRGLDRDTALQIIVACNNIPKIGAAIERKLNLPNQHTSRIKRGLRYREYYDEYLKFSEEETRQWLDKAKISFNI